MIPVIIPFYKNQTQLTRCIEHLNRQTHPVEIFVRDNSEDNVFFTKAVNEGLRHFLDQDCPYLIALNQDMYLEPNAVEAMVTFMDEHPRCGIGSPLEHLCGQPEDQVMGGGKECFPYGVHEVGRRDQLCQSDQILWANGSCMILRRAMIREIGLLDENFIFLASDSDYSFTARSRGWEVWRIGTALGHHEHGASGECSDLTLKLLKIQDMLHFAKKWINGGLYQEIAHIPADHDTAFITSAIEQLEQARDRTTVQVQRNRRSQVAEASDRYEPLLQQAVRCHQAGDAEQAERLYGQVLEREPHQALALHSLGILAYDRGDVEDAHEFVSQAILENPHQALPYNTMGVIYEALKDDDKAVRAFEQAVKLQDDYLEARLNLATALARQGQTDQAVTLLQQAVQADPANAWPHYHLGRVYQQQNRLAEASVSLEEALRLEPSFADACWALAVTYRRQGQWDQALDLQQQALQWGPDNPAYLSHQALLLQETGRLTEALQICQQLVQRFPDQAESYYNLACVLRDQGHLDQAINTNEQALQRHPDFAEAHWNQAVCLLTAGRSEQAWEHYLWRHQVGDVNLYPHHHDIPRWDGGDLTGRRLYVHCEQGLGDALQMARFLPTLKQRGATVVFGLWRPLTALMEYIPGVDEIVALDWHTAPEVQADLMVSLMDLPALLHGSPRNTPAPTSGLTIDPVKQIHWQRHWATHSVKVGLVWAGSARHTNNCRRSCGFAVMRSLTEVPGIHFISLQRDDWDLKTREHVQRAGVEDISASLHEFTDTAAIISNLDLVISVDTAVLHLAATLGKPTWGLLPFSPDWRWMLDRTDSPWYPSLRLFRQLKPGDWDGVFGRVHEALVAWRNERSGALVSG